MRRVLSSSSTAQDMQRRRLPVQSYPQLKVHKPGQGRGGYGICLYGRSGAGKTSLLGTLPGKGLVIDVPQMEGGTEVLDTPELAARIDIHDITSWDEVEE